MSAGGVNLVLVYTILNWKLFDYTGSQLLDLPTLTRLNSYSLRVLTKVNKCWQMKIFHSPSINPLVVEERLWRDEANDCQAIRAFNLPCLCPGQGGGLLLSLVKTNLQRKRHPTLSPRKSKLGTQKQQTLLSRMELLLLTEDFPLLFCRQWTDGDLS